jgi:hypothetical protein
LPITEKTRKRIERRKALERARLAEIEEATGMHVTSLDNSVILSFSSTKVSEPEDVGDSVAPSTSVEKLEIAETEEEEQKLFLADKPKKKKVKRKRKKKNKKQPVDSS